jgi:hypothetical protein
MKRISQKTKTWLTALAVAAGTLSGFSAPQTDAAVANVKLAKNAVTLKITKTAKKTTYGTSSITVTAKKGVKVKKITYSVKKSSIASVSGSGTVKAKKVGKTNVSVNVTYKKNKKKSTKTLIYHVAVIKVDKIKATASPKTTATVETAAPFWLVRLADTPHPTRSIFFRYKMQRREELSFFRPQN